MDAPFTHTSARVRVPSLTSLVDAMTLSAAEAELGLASAAEPNSQPPKPSAASLEWIACCGLRHEHQSV